MQKTTSATGANVEALEIERYMYKDEVLCERRLRRSSRNNPFTVQGVCDICGETDPQMNLAVYTFPNKPCICCEGEHTLITKFCNKCTPISPARIFRASEFSEERAKNALVKKFGKDYKDLLVKDTFRVEANSRFIR